MFTGAAARSGAVRAPVSAAHVVRARARGGATPMLSRRWITSHQVQGRKFRGVPTSGLLADRQIAFDRRLGAGHPGELAIAAAYDKAEGEEDYHDEATHTVHTSGVDLNNPSHVAAMLQRARKYLRPGEPDHLTAMNAHFLRAYSGDATPGTPEYTQGVRDESVRVLKGVPRALRDVMKRHPGLVSHDVMLRMMLSGVPGYAPNIHDADTHVKPVVEEADDEVSGSYASQAFTTEDKYPAEGNLENLGKHVDIQKHRMALIRLRRQMQQVAAAPAGKDEELA